MWGELAIVGLLIVLNGFFAMAEIAIVSARRGRLKQMLDDRIAGAAQALELAENPSRLLSTVQTGITFVGVFAGVFSGATLAERLGVYFDETFPALAPHGPTVALVLVVAVVSYLTLFMGELVPKRVAIARAEDLAVLTARPLVILGRVLAPLVWLLEVSTDFFLRLMGLGRGDAPAVTEDEVKNMIAEGTQEGVFEPAEQAMIEGVMRLTDRTVRTIMTPRIDMVWLADDADPAELRDTVRSSGYSRFPLARGDLDEVLGIIHAKDLLNAALAGQTVDLMTLRRPVLSVPDTMPVMKLLEQFKATGQHQAVVIDEYGTVEGLVCVADILMAIAGDLPEGLETASDAPVQRADGSWLIDAMTPIDEVENLLNLRDMEGEGDFHTLAGFILEHLGRIPVAGDRFVWQDIQFEVVDMDGRRVDKVLVSSAVRSDDHLGGGGGV